MPIYQYECPECGLEVERLHENSEEAEPPSCPQGLKEDENCGEPYDSAAYLFERKIGRPNAHFKGSGFYVNDADDAENPASNDK